MKRRDFVKAVACSAAGWPLGARAQQRERPRRAFWVSTESQPDPFIDGFKDGLRERGYADGKDVVFELRYAPGNPDALRTVIAELTRDKVDLAVSSGPAIRAMRAATDVTGCLRSAAIPSSWGWSRAWLGREATSRAAPSFPWTWRKRGWSS